MKEVIFLHFWALVFLTGIASCSTGQAPADLASVTVENSPEIFDQSIDQMAKDEKYGKGALLLSRFDSFPEFKKVVHIEYCREFNLFSYPAFSIPVVRIKHKSGGKIVTGILKPGVTEGDFAKARDGKFRDRLSLLLRSPYAILKRKELQRVYALSRWRDQFYGEGDIAFYDLARTMMDHITDYDKQNSPSREFGEKGYINTFNHVIAQAFMTSLFSERLADFVADSHERYNLPQLISGNFTEEMVYDIETGPTDNYLDIINNEWGQEIGKELKRRYNIRKSTIWTTELLENYLNDIQHYFTISFQIGFDPFFASDEILIRLSKKIEQVKKGAPLMK